MPDYWTERRRAALTEAKAIEEWLKGCIDDATLQSELRRADQTRLKAMAYLPKTDRIAVRKDTSH